MPKTVTVSEAKNKLSSMLQWAVDNRDEVVVESHGEPKAVILPYGEYEEFLTFREQARRREAFRQLEELAERVRARNADLTTEEAEQLADEITRETIQRMVDEGKVIFQS
ncbi:type II toxin-antitoxin system Phd/YefM family antitoxin [Promineifilum sp.]|uniref:type II toxin-antitoxin system Phd/YefM family antitoxin n=1 Tax=Promineifilum sp. TaxID=2664178 RepID=UPI0035B2BA16